MHNVLFVRLCNLYNSGIDAFSWEDYNETAKTGKLCERKGKKEKLI